MGSRARPAVGFCQTCEKSNFLTRRDAKGSIRRLQRRKGRLHAYRCPASDYWHKGHLPARVIAGDTPRNQIPPRRKP